MSETAADRKKAKEAYMKALEDQRVSKLTETSAPVVSTIKRVSDQPLTAAEKREQMLEERRRNFFDKKSSQNDSAPTATISQPASNLVAMQPLDFGSINTKQDMLHPPKVSARMPTVAEHNNITAIDFSKPPPTTNNSYGTAQPPPTNSVPVPSFNFNATPQPGMSIAPPVDEREVKRLKQEEYSRGLQADLATANNKAALQQQQQQRDYDQRNPQNAGALNIGGGYSLSPTDRHNPNDDHARKVAQQQEYAKQLESQQQIHNQQNGHRGHVVSEPVSSFNIGGATGVSEKDSKRAKQEEYARDLQNQQHMAQMQKQNKPHSAAGGGALNGLGGDTTVAEQNQQALLRKQQQQQEYARQLQSDMHTQNNHLQQNRDNAAPSFNIGRPVDNEREMKRLKQEEYTRGLDSQMRQKEGHSHHGQLGHQQAPVQYDGFGGQGISEKDSKRAKQEEYARDLQNQQHMAQMQKQNKPHSAAGGGALSGLGGGGGVTDFNEAARLKKVQQQQEYARQLDIERDVARQLKQQQGGGRGNEHHNQQHQQQAQSQYQPQQQYGQQQQGFDSNPFQPQQQLQHSMFPPQNQQYSQHTNQHHSPQHQQQQQFQQPQYGMATIGVAPLNDNDAKRAKQQEYAQSLLQQQLIHQQAKDSQHNRHRAADLTTQAQHNGVTTPGGGLDPGWMIGPLGNPVRKVLEVGNRGVQKAFTHQTVLSPGKMNRGQGGGIASAAAAYGNPNPYGDHSPTHMMSQFGNPYGAMGGAGIGGVPNVDMYGNPQPSADLYGAPQTTQFGGPVVAGAVNMMGSDLDQRAQHQKNLKADQARVLLEQIDNNKRIKEQEKRKLQEEEENLLLKLAKQQQELIAAHDKAEKEKKAKEHEDMQRAQAKQIADRKQAKEDEELKQKALDQKEHDRVIREIALLKQKEHEEMLKERADLERLQQQKQGGGGSLSPKRGIQQYTSPEKQYNTQPASRQLSQQTASPSRQLDLKKNLFDPPDRDDHSLNTFRTTSAGSTARDKSHLFDNQQDDIPVTMLQMPKSRGRVESSNNYFNNNNDDDQRDQSESPQKSSRRDNKPKYQHNAPPSPAKQHVAKKLQQRVVQEADQHQYGRQQYGEEQEEEEERLPRSRQTSSHQQTQSANAWNDFAGGGSEVEDRHAQNEGHYGRVKTPNNHCNNGTSERSPKRVQPVMRQPPPRQQSDFQQQTTARGTDHERDERMSTRPTQYKAVPPPTNINISQPPQRQQHQSPSHNQHRHNTDHHNHGHKHGDLDSSMRLDRTLQFESKFILPGGEIFSSHSHKDKQDEDTPMESESQTVYNNYINSQQSAQSETKSQSTKSNKQGLSLSELMANMNWNDSIQLNTSNNNKNSESVNKSVNTNHRSSPEKKSTTDSDSHNKPVVINRDTKSLIDEFHDSLHSLMDADHSIAKDSKQQSSSAEKKEVDSLTSEVDVDVDKVYRKNRRRADVLNRLNGANSGSGLEHASLEEMYHSLAGISSRPSTAGSTRPSTVFNGLLSGAASALQRAAPVNKLSAADEYMRNYRANKTKGSLNTQLTKLNLDDLLAADEGGGYVSARPRSEGLGSSLKRGNGGGGIAAGGGRQVYGQQEETNKLGSSSSRMPLSARGRAVLEGNMGRGNQIGSSIQHTQHSNLNNNNAYYQSHHDSDDDDDNYSEYGL